MAEMAPASRGDLIAFRWWPGDTLHGWRVGVVTRVDDGGNATRAKIRVGQGWRYVDLAEDAIGARYVTAEPRAAEIAWGVYRYCANFDDLQAAVRERLNAPSQ